MLKQPTVVLSPIVKGIETTIWLTSLVTFAAAFGLAILQSVFYRLGVAKLLDLAHPYFLALCMGINAATQVWAREAFVPGALVMWALQFVPCPLAEKLGNEILTMRLKYYDAKRDEPLRAAGVWFRWITWLAFRLAVGAAAFTRVPKELIELWRLLRGDR